MQFRFIIITLQFKVLFKMSEKDYLQDLSHIKNIMNKSSRFLSLSGLSGILAGIFALIGAFLAHGFVKDYFKLIYNSNKQAYVESTSDFMNLEVKLLAIAGTVALLSIICAFILTKNKAKEHGVSIWDATSKRLLFHFLVPLATGGVFSITLLSYGYYGFIAPATLIFYGLAIVNASNYTVGNVKYLGLAEIILGLIAMQFIGYGLYFWAIGFGIFHIIYGSVMYFIIEKK